MAGRLNARACMLAGLAALAGAGTLHAGGVPHPRIREGNRAYDAEAYVEAEVKYRKALEAAADQPEARFDLGDALYRQGRYEPAANEFERAGASEDVRLRADACFNRGNALFRQQKYAESMEAYADALRADPGHEDARYNLSVARRRLHAQRSQPQQSGQPEAGGKPGQKGDEDTRRAADQNTRQEQSPPQEGRSGQREPPAGEGKRPEADRSREAQGRENPGSAERRGEDVAGREPEEGAAADGQRGNPAGSPERAISTAEADRILQAVRDDEKEVQRKLRARAAGRVDVEKDW